MLNCAHLGPIAQRERSGTGTRVHARRGAGAHLLDRQIHRSARIAVANQSHKRRDGGQEQRHALRIYIHESAQGHIFHMPTSPLSDRTTTATPSLTLSLELGGGTAHSEG